jgi:serine protease Do
VTTKNEREYKAKVVGTDPKSDLAVLRVKDKGVALKPIALGDSSRLRLGDVVLAIGNPFGIGETVTMGIVSATGRAGLGIVDYESFIQTDAAINPGNSGGALIDTEGKLVGISTAIVSRSGGNNGIGFAIPSNMAQPIMKSILEHGKVIRGWLGVTIQDLKPELAEALGVEAQSGVLISEVRPDTPAAKAGLKQGDIVTRLNGKKVTSTSDFRNRIAVAGPNAEAKLEILRDKKTEHKSIKLGELPADEGLASGVSGGKPSNLDGLSIAPLSSGLRKKYELPDSLQQGVVVTDVEEGSIGAFAGLRPGDVVVEVNRQPVTSTDTFRRLWSGAKHRVLLLVSRGGTTIFMVVTKE